MSIVDKELYKGIAIIIDDGIKKEKAIDQIIAKIKEAGIPICEIDNLDFVEKSIENFVSINFIIIDWNMFENFPLERGATIPPQLREEIHKHVIEIIKKLKDICFAPIFIFTEENQRDIEDQIIPKLIDEKLYFKEEGKNFIYVRNKKDLLENNKLFEDIVDWIKKNPSVYVLKSWEKEFLQAQNIVFWNLYNKTPSWPKILWKCFEDEKENPDSCINDVIFRLIMANIFSLNVDRDIIIQSKGSPIINEIKELIKGTMYINGEIMGNKLYGLKPGDIFKLKGKYYLNIRPECDTVEKRIPSWKDAYCIVGQTFSSGQRKKLIEEGQYSEYCGFVEKIGSCFLFMLDNHDIVNFNFQKIEKIEITNEIIKKRLCRLLSPYITRVQQRFSSYIGRIGTLRLPIEIEHDILTLIKF